MQEKWWWRSHRPKLEQSFGAASVLASGLLRSPATRGAVPSIRKPWTNWSNHSPKMRWMLGELLRIQSREEKVIVFCEFKELQRTIQRAIAERLGIVADIINGDTSATGRADTYSTEES